MHHTRIEPEQITVMENDERTRVVAFRVHCDCGWCSPLPLLNQTDANNEARAHREIYGGEARTAH
jgi:hypothetical protein